MNNIKNIAFDVGGVLAEPITGHWFITPNFWNIIDKDIINIDNLKETLHRNSDLLTQLPKSEKDEFDMYCNFYNKVLFDLNYKNGNIAKELAKDCVYNDTKYLFYDDVKTTLEKLSKTYNLYIISDAWPSSYRVLKNIGIDRYFKDILISSTYSTTKKDNLFQVFKEKDINMEETLFIDDRIDLINRAIEFGLKTLLMDRKNINNYDVKITNLKELEAFLE